MTAFEAFKQDFSNDYPLDFRHPDEYQVRPSLVRKYKKDKLDGRTLKA